MKKVKRKPYSNNAGFITVEFTFAFLVATMLSALLFAMCFTFTVIEIGQYISFSATRAAIVAHKSYDDQRQRGEAKLNALLGHPEILPLISNGWFELSLRDIRLGQNSSDYYNEDYQPSSPLKGKAGGEFFVPASGFRLNLKAKILELRLGPLGNIESEEGDGFNLTIATLLFREPSQAECQSSIAARYNQVLNLDQGYASLASQYASDYVPMEDNGC